jgi:tetratricopeptide (TPR) repeat protein
MTADEDTPVDEAYAEAFAALESAMFGRAPAPDSIPSDERGRLGQDLACAHLLHRVLGSDASTVPGVGRDAAAGNLPWAVLGRFELRRELGRGGFGVVYLAYDPALGREVALKVPRLEAALTSDLRDRFRTEARAAAGLDHPNLVPVYEVGEVGPVCYLVSAYCPGASLADWLRRRADPVPFRLAAGLAAKLAEAVEHAHAHGVLHRDLKPANVLLETPEDSEATDGLGFVPRVTDFGLAKLMDPAGPAGPTRTGAVLGTPAYMAPEQAGGKARAVGPAADVYSLGAILYELLTGRPPFVGESDLDTLHQVRSAEAVSPSRLRPRVPRDLETICLKCLEKDSARRYPTAAALAGDLNRFLAGQSVRARPVGRPERAWRYCCRRPLVASLTAALIVAVGSGLVGLTLLWRHAEDQRAQAEENASRFDNERRRAEDNLDQAWRAVREHFVTLSEVRRDDPRDPKEVQRTQHEAALRYFREFLTQRRDDPALRAEVADAHYRVGRLTLEIGSPVEALAALEEARDLQEQLARDDPANIGHRTALANTLNELGRVHGTRSDRRAALRCYDQARVAWEQLAAEYPGVPKFQSALCVAWHNLGNVNQSLQDLRAARGAFLEARRLWADLLRRHPDGTDNQIGQALTCHDLGHVERLQGDKDAARRLYDEARSLQEAVLRRSPLSAHAQASLAATCNSLCVLLLQYFREPTAAIVAGDRSRVLLERLTQNHPAVVGYQVELARTYANLGRAQRGAKDRAAQGSLDQARVLQERLVEVHPTIPQYRLELAVTYADLAGLHKDAGDYPASLRMYERAREMQLYLVQADPKNLDYQSLLGGTLNNLALTLEKLGRLDDALAATVRAIEHQQMAHAGAPAVRTYRQFLINHRVNRARFLRLLGRPAEAASALDEGSELMAGHAESLYYAATEFAACIPLVGGGKLDLTSVEAAERRRLADRAVELLRRAVADGYRDLFRLRNAPELEPLRARADFQQLLSQLDRAAKPTTK